MIAFVERYLTTPKGTGARKRMQLRPWQREIVHGLFDEPRPRQAWSPYLAATARAPWPLRWPCTGCWRTA